MGEKIYQKSIKKRGQHGNLASIFNGFWWIWGGKLGSKINQKSIQESIEKTMEKWKASRWRKSRNKAQKRPATPGSQWKPNNLQNGPQKPPKESPGPSKIEPKWGQEKARTTKKSKNNIDPTKTSLPLNSPGVFCAKKWPTWFQFDFQKPPKINKKSMPKSVKNLMHLGIDF